MFFNFIVLLLSLTLYYYLIYYNVFLRINSYIVYVTTTDLLCVCINHVFFYFFINFISIFYVYYFLLFTFCFEYNSLINYYLIMFMHDDGNFSNTRIESKMGNHVRKGIIDREVFGRSLSCILMWRRGDNIRFVFK